MKFSPAGIRECSDDGLEGVGNDGVESREPLGPKPLKHESGRSQSTDAKQVAAIHRRDWLRLTAGGALATMAGCNSSSEKSDTGPDGTQPRTDVPLRVLMVGTETMAESISAGWSSMSAVQLDFTLISNDRQESNSLSQRVAEKVDQSDVVIYPLILQGELAATNGIVPQADETFTQWEESLGRVFPSLRNGACRLGGQFYGLSLGSRLPALLTLDETEEIKTWQQYLNWVESVSGKAGEPLAPGWAAQSFLRRAASSVQQGWLFDRERLVPRINTEPYADALNLLVRTAKAYEEWAMIPQDIWSEVRNGRLQGGISYMVAGDIAPESEATEPRDVTFQDLPNELDSNAVLLEEFSLAVSISGRCRQSTTSKQFLAWLSGGEGSEGLAEQVTALTGSRENEESPAADSGYDTWLISRLGTPQVRSTMRLINGGAYYHVLDQQVVACLKGESKPVQALEEVANRWESLTEEVGREKQRAAWRAADGLGRV